MHLETIISEQRLLEIIPAWESLVSNHYISMSPRWLVTWWDCYKEDMYQLKIYSAWENAELRGILPLMLEKSETTTTLRFLSNSCSDYLGVFVRDANYSCLDLFACAIEDDDSWDDFLLDNIDAEDKHTEHLVKKLLENNRVIVSKKHADIAKISIISPWETFIAQKSRNIRHAYSRIEKFASKFLFEVRRDYDQWLVNEIFNLHTARWERINFSSVFSDVRRRMFFHSIAKEFSANGKLIIFTLLYEGKLAAYRFGFIQGETYFDWNTSYDPNYETYSCGKLLLTHVYKFCYKHKIKVFDFMKGLERYKVELMTEKGYLYSAQCTRERVLIDYSPPKEKVKETVSKAKGVIFDLDGVVYSGKNPISDTIKTIAHLQDLKIKIGYLTNTSAKTVREIQGKLEEMGVDTEDSYIMTSAVATGQYLAENQCGSCVVFGGGNSLFEEICKHDITAHRGKFDLTRPNLKPPSAVVIGYTTDFTYEDFIFCANLINNGSKLICTDKDNKFAHNGSWLPGTGWIVSSLEYVTSKKAITIGKPKTISLSYIMSEMQIDKDSLLLIGDNIDTDIMAAKEMGISSCLLLGGISQKSDVAKFANSKKPDMVVNSLANIYEYFMEV